MHSSDPEREKNIQFRMDFYAEVPGDGVIVDYLAVIVDSYLQKRRLWYDTNDGPKEWIVSEDVLQGSALCPLLWNIMYNGVLNLPVPEKARVAGYADDITLIMVAQRLESTELYSCKTTGAIKACSESAEILPEEKTKAVLNIKPRNKNYGPLIIGSHVGVMIDEQINFRKHVD